jgi:hypothetical protein
MRSRMVTKNRKKRSKSNWNKWIGITISEAFPSEKMYVSSS